jgi:hypothetical protein
VSKHHLKNFSLNNAREVSHFGGSHYADDRIREAYDFWGKAPVPSVP